MSYEPPQYPPTRPMQPGDYGTPQSAPPAGYWPPQSPPPKKWSAGKVVVLVAGLFVFGCLSMTIIAVVSDDGTGTAAKVPAVTEAAKAVQPAAPAAPVVPEKSTVRTPAALDKPAAPAEVEMPDLRGQNAAVAQDYLTRLGFTRVEFGSQDELDSWVVLPENWTVKKQSTKPGRKIPVDTLIVLTCTKTS